MKRVCIIGDSHINAILGGWDLIKSERSDIELTFFAAGQKNLSSLEVSSGRLVSNDAFCTLRMMRSSNGLGAIDGDYDCYIVLGLEFGFNLAVNLCGLYRIECEAVDPRTPISDACFECAVEDILRNTLSVDTVLKLQEITKAPIAIIPYPLRSRWGSSAPWRSRESEIKKAVVSAANRLSEEVGFRLILQPDQTLSTPFTTNPIYSRVPGAADGHMNGAYGKEMLNIVLEGSPVGLL